MRKLVVINSFGPMASTLLAGLIEKFGYSNVPIRKLRLHEYLMGDLTLESGVMQQRLKSVMLAHAQKSRTGGVSVLDRNSQEPKALLDGSRAAQSIAEFETKQFESIQDLYFECHKIYNKALSYKQSSHNDGWHIELTVDFHRYDTEKICAHYKEHFDDVKFIHLKRDFRHWINALASQAFFHPHLKERLKFFPSQRYKDFLLYEDAVQRAPGLTIQFDQLFDTPIEQLSQTISDYLASPAPTVDLRNSKYDMYGKILHYEVAFKRFDDNISFLRPSTLDYLEKSAKSGRIIKFPTNVIAWLKCIDDSRRFLKKHKQR